MLESCSYGHWDTFGDTDPVRSVLALKETTILSRLPHRILGKLTLGSGVRGLRRGRRGTPKATGLAGSRSRRDEVRHTVNELSLDTG